MDTRASWVVTEARKSLLLVFNILLYSGTSPPAWDTVHYVCLRINSTFLSQFANIAQNIQHIDIFLKINGFKKRQFKYGNRLMHNAIA